MATPCPIGSVIFIPCKLCVNLKITFSGTPFLKAALHAADRVLCAVNLVVSTPAENNVFLIQREIVSDPTCLWGDA